MSVDSYYLNPLLKIPTYQPVIIKLLGAGILYSVAGFISCGPPIYFRHLRAERCKINQQLSYLGRVVGLHKTNCFYSCGSQGTSCKNFVRLQNVTVECSKSILIQDVRPEFERRFVFVVTLLETLCRTHRGTC
jgi:hypothetical protein